MNPSSEEAFCTVLDKQLQGATDEKKKDAYTEMIKTILREKNAAIMKDYVGGVLDVATQASDEVSAVGFATDTSTTAFSDDSDDDDDSSDEESSDEDSTEEEDLSTIDGESEDESDEEDEEDEEDEDLVLLEQMAAEIARMASQKSMKLPRNVEVPTVATAPRGRPKVDRSLPKQESEPKVHPAKTGGAKFVVTSIVKEPPHVPSIVREPPHVPSTVKQPPQPSGIPFEEPKKEVPRRQASLSSVVPKGILTVTFGSSEFIEEVKPAFGASGDISPTLRLLDMVGAEGPEDLFIPTEAVEDFFIQPTQEQIDAYNLRFVRALRRNDLPEIRRMHEEEGHILQASNPYGETVVHIACRRGALDIIKYMVEEGGVSIRVRDDYGRTPLHDSCWTAEPHVELLSYLVHLEPDLLFMTDTKGFTPLEYARLEHRSVWNQFLEQIHDVVSSRCEGGILKLKCAI